MQIVIESYTGKITFKVSFDFYIPPRGVSGLTCAPVKGVPPVRISVGAALRLLTATPYILTSIGVRTKGSLIYRGVEQLVAHQAHILKAVLNGSNPTSATMKRVV